MNTGVLKIQNESNVLKTKKPEIEQLHTENTLMATVSSEHKHILHQNIGKNCLSERFGLNDHKRRPFISTDKKLHWLQL